MSETQGNQFGDLMDQYRRQFDELATTQSKLKAITCTASSPRKEVTVTAGFGGAITAVDFPSSAYKRMAPAELSKLVLETMREAQRLVGEAATELVAPTLPEGMDAQKLMSGDLGLEAFMPEPTEEDILSSGLASGLFGRPNTTER